MNAVAARPHALTLLGLLVVFSLWSCATTLNRLPPGERAAALAQGDRAIERLHRINGQLRSFNGKGKIKIFREGRAVVAERVAWIAAPPDRIRIAVLVSGRPMIQIAADGQHLYFVDLTDPGGGGYRKYRTASAELDPLVGLPVTTTDIIALLSGRPPIHEYSRAFLIERAHGPGTVLVLEHWWKVVEKIYLDADAAEVSRVEFFGGDGRLRYRAEMDGRQDFPGCRIPLRISLSDDSRAAVELDIEHCRVDVPVEEATFVLPKPL
jgi:hypothetical protein